MVVRAPTSAVLIIGNEILSGRTAESNLQHIAQQLAQRGIVLHQAQIVVDEREAIIAALESLRHTHDYVFTTGGLGPTHDDVTTAAVAACFERAVILNPRARAKLLAHYGEDKLTQARLKMAHLPEGVELIDNPVSAAPGFRIDNVFVLAGVPEIMRAMLAGCLSRIVGGPALQSRTVHCLVPESTVAAELERIAGQFPECDIGSYPWFRFGQYGLALVVRCSDRAQLDAAASAVLELAQNYDPLAQLAL
jgi:molybdenum cofactor synthesis domain-containing protein